MLCSRRPINLSSPFSLSSIIPLKPFFLRRHTSLTPPPLKIMSAATPNNVIEHIVLFKVKTNTDPTQVNAMVNGLNTLTSLPQVLHLNATQLLRTRSQSPLSFTHILHSRYNSESDLSDYSLHPSHVSVVNDFVKPIVDDIMAVDWVSNDVMGNSDSAILKPGSGVRVSLLKLKEGLEEREKERILGVVGGIRSKFEGVIEQISCGVNFSPGRAKGYSIGSVAVFRGLEELDSLDSNTEVVNEEKEKVRDLLDSVLVLDYVVPQSQSATTSL